MAGTRRTAARAAVAGTTSVAVAGLGAAAVATVFARRIVTPDGVRPDDVEVLSVDSGTVTVAATPETLGAGRCGIWQDGGRTHLRVGEVAGREGHGVVRPLIGIDRGAPQAGPGRWNQYYFSGTPSSALGLDHLDVVVPGGTGPLPGWLVPGGGRTPGRTWAVLVHGRGATREETLRALPGLHRLGITSLVASYNTTEGLPEPVAGRYHLGDREWLDVESAVIYAAENGADEVILFGWSMGAAICLQVVSRSWTHPRVRGLVLDSPVIDWRDVLAHQARVNRLPRPVGWLGQQVLSHRAAWRLIGTDAPVDLDRLDWLTRADELRLPMLLIHSFADDFVPAGPSRALATARPDLVTYLDVPGARHTRGWNVDPEAWDAAVATFALRL